MAKLEVFKKDLMKIGYDAAKNDDDKLMIITDYTSHSLEEILLRSILRTFGNYEIVDIEVYDDDDMSFITNLPFSEYLKLIA